MTSESTIAKTLMILKENKKALFGVSVVAIVVFMALAPSIIAPYGPNEMHPSSRLAPPSLKFLLGTDLFGRDILSRIIYGAAVPVFIGGPSVFLAMWIGTILGCFAGYYGRILDQVTQRIFDITFAFPSLLLAILISTVIGPAYSNWAVALVIIVVMVPVFGRNVRASALEVKEREYVLAARILGYGNLRIVLRHVLPNCMATAIVIAAVSVAWSVLLEASLSFLGLGTQPPTPSWGYDLRAGVVYLEQAPGMTIFPGIAILLTVLGFNMLGDALRDILDPRLKI